ncbi:MAG: DUF4262 domain-containing protein, partial [Kibdelosporangium sp.]
DAIDTDLAANVTKHGWAVMAIPADESSAGWAFTVGLWHTYRAPELAIFGLDSTVARDCLNTIGDQVQAGRVPAAGDELADVLTNGYVVALRPVDEGWRKAFLGASVGYYRATGPPVPYLQVLWPDRAGKYPGDNDFAVQLAETQPQLWLPHDAHPPGPWTAQV